MHTWLLLPLAVPTNPLVSTPLQGEALGAREDFRRCRTGALRVHLRCGGHKQGAAEGHPVAGLRRGVCQPRFRSRAALRSHRGTKEAAE